MGDGIKEQTNSKIGRYIDRWTIDLKMDKYMCFWIVIQIYNQMVLQIDVRPKKLIYTFINSQIDRWMAVYVHRQLYQSDR